MNVLCCLLAGSLTESRSATHGLNEGPHGLDVGTVFTHVVAQELPVRPSFFVALVLQANPPDHGRTCAVACRVVDGAGRRVFETIAPAEVTVPPGLEEPLAPLPAPLLVEPLIPAAGRYVVEALVDGAVVGRLPLHVSLRAAGETEALAREGATEE